MAIEIAGPFGISKATDKVSRDATLRFLSYCYSPQARKRLVVFLIRGDELSAIRKGWPLPLHSHANFLSFIGEFKPAAVFFDIGLVKAGSVASLDQDPCRAVNHKQAPTSRWVAEDNATAVSPAVVEFSNVFETELKEWYAPVDLSQLRKEEGTLFDRTGNDKVPLLLASGNPRSNAWMAGFKPHWQREEEKPDVPVGRSHSASLLLDCMNDIGTAVPVRWEPTEGYPLSIRTDPAGPSSNDEPPVYEPSPAYLLYRLYCESPQSKQEDFQLAGCRADEIAAFSALNKGLPEDNLIIEWGRLAQSQDPVDAIWECEQEKDSRSFLRYFGADVFRGILPASELNVRCPFHPTIPFVHGQSWPSEIGDPEDVIRGKIVIIGTDIGGWFDRLETPVHGAYPGALVHAMAVDNLLQKGNRHFKPAPYWMLGDYLKIDVLDIVEGLSVLFAALVGFFYRRHYLIADGKIRDYEQSKLTKSDFCDTPGKIQAALLWLFPRCPETFDRWYSPSARQSTPPATFVCFHNCKVQETAFRLSIIALFFAFFAYYAVARKFNVDPVLDYILPSLFIVFHPPCGPRPILASSFAGFARLLSREGILRLLYSMLIAAVLLVLVRGGCGQLQSSDLVFLGVVVVGIAYWLTGAATDGIRIHRSLKQLDRDLSPQQKGKVNEDV